MVTKTFTADAFLVATLTKTFTTDAVLSDRETGVTLTVNGVDYSNFSLNYWYKERINEIGEFWIDFLGVSDTQRSTDILQDKVVLFKSKGDLLFKGVLERPDYQTGEEITARGLDAGSSYCKRVTADETAASDATSSEFRPNYDDVAIATIISEQLANISNVSVDGTDDGSTLGNGSYRGEHVSILSMIANPVMKNGGDWWFTYGSAPSYTSNVFHAKTARGSGSSVKTYAVNGGSQNANLTKNEQDFENLWNFVEILGYGDGINQKRSVNFNATDNRSTLDGDITATDTTISLVDASSFPASGDVWIGMEKVSYSGKASNDLTGCTRGVAGGIDAYAHDDGIEVYDAQYTATVAGSEAGSSIKVYGLNQKTLQDKSIIDQNTLDRIAQEVRAEHDELVTRIVLEPSDPYEAIRDVQVGDTITISDDDSDLDDDFIVVVKEFKSEDGLENCTFECANKRLNAGETDDETRSIAELESKFMQGSTNIFVVNETENAEAPTDLVLDDFEDNWSNWVESNDGLAAVQNTAIEQEGSSCIELGIDASASGTTTAGWKNTTDSFDISDYTGVTSGAPIRGKLKFWIRFSTTDYLLGTDPFQIFIGSSGIDFCQYTIDDTELDANADGAWYAYEVNLTDYKSIAGTPDWTAIDIIDISVLELIGNTNDFTLYLDHLRLDGVESSSVGPIEVFFEVPAEAVGINQIKLAYRNEAPRIWSNVTESSVASTVPFLLSAGQTNKTYTHNTWNTIDSFSGSSNDSDFLVFTGSLEMDDGSDPGVHDISIRIYDGTTYFPSSSGLQSFWGRSNTTSTSRSLPNFSAVFPVQINGKTISLDVKLNHPSASGSVTFNTRWQAFAIGKHTHSSAYDIATKTYSTTDIRIYTSDDASGSPSYTERTAAIETALGGALTATENGNETDIDLTSYFSSTGWKAVKLVTDGNSRHKIQVLSKVFIESKDV